MIKAILLCTSHMVGPSWQQAFLVSRRRKFHVLFYRQILVCIEIQATFTPVDIFSARFIQFLMLWRVRNHAQHCSFTHLSFELPVGCKSQMQKGSSFFSFSRVSCALQIQRLFSVACLEQSWKAFETDYKSDILEQAIMMHRNLCKLVMKFKGTRNQSVPAEGGIISGLQ